MLLRGNTASPQDFAAVLGAMPRPVDSFVAEREAGALATAGRLWWLLPLLRGAVALLWIASGVVSLGVYPLEASYALLARVGLSGGLAALALYGAAVLDILFGLAIYLVRRRRWLWRLQIAVILVYSAIIAFALPEFWLHPFAPMVKNLPLLVALLLLHELDDGR
jgi:DoxX-like family